MIKHIGQLFDMIGSRLLTEMDSLQKYSAFLLYVRDLSLICGIVAAAWTI